MNIPHWLYLLPVVALNVCASLLLKTGATARPASFFLGYLSWTSFCGLFCFGLGGVAYAWLLRFVPLNVAQAVLASQYIFTLLGAYFLLREPISSMQLAGFVLVGLGIALVVSN